MEGVGRRGARRGSRERRSRERGSRSGQGGGRRRGDNTWGRRRRSGRMVERWKSGFVPRLVRGERTREVDICEEYEDGLAPENGWPLSVVFGDGAADDGGAVVHKVEDADRDGADADKGVREGAHGVESIGGDARGSVDDVVLLTTGAGGTARASSGAARGELGEILSRHFVLAPPAFRHFHRTIQGSVALLGHRSRPQLDLAKR